MWCCRGLHYTDICQCNAFPCSTAHTGITTYLLWVCRTCVADIFSLRQGFCPFACFLGCSTLSSLSHRSVGLPTGNASEWASAAPRIRRTLLQKRRFSLWTKLRDILMRSFLTFDLSTHPQVTLKKKNFLTFPKSFLHYISILWCSNQSVEILLYVSQRRINKRLNLTALLCLLC